MLNGGTIPIRVLTGNRTKIPVIRTSVCRPPPVCNREGFMFSILKNLAES